MKSAGGVERAARGAAAGRKDERQGDGEGEESKGTVEC